MKWKISQLYCSPPHHIASSLPRSSTVEGYSCIESADYYNQLMVFFCRWRSGQWIIFQPQVFGWGGCALGMVMVSGLGCNAIYYKNKVKYIHVLVIYFQFSDLVPSNNYLFLLDKTHLYFHSKWKNGMYQDILIVLGFVTDMIRHIYMCNN